MQMLPHKFYFLVFEPENSNSFPPNCSMVKEVGYRVAEHGCGSQFRQVASPTSCDPRLRGAGAFSLPSL